MAWVHADATCKRLDEKYLVNQRVQMPLPHLACVLSEVSIYLLTYCLLSFVMCIVHCVPCKPP